MLQGGELGFWLQNNGITEKEFQPWISYVLTSEDGDLLAHSQKGIELCVKDAYGCPYIPGSSLKGDIRNALLNYDIFNNPQSYQPVRNCIERV